MPLTEVIKVNSSCASSLSTWLKAHPLLFNAELISSAGGAGTSGGRSGHVSAADIAVHSIYAKSQLELELDIANNQRIQIMVAPDIQQAQLDTIACALYARSISLDTTCVEGIMRAAHFLQLQVVIDACAEYYCKHSDALGLQAYELASTLGIDALKEQLCANMLKDYKANFNPSMLVEFLKKLSVPRISSFLTTDCRTDTFGQVLDILQQLPERCKLLVGLSSQLDALSQKQQPHISAMVSEAAAHDDSGLIDDFWKQLLIQLLLRYSLSCWPQFGWLWQSSCFTQWHVEANELLKRHQNRNELPCDCSVTTSGIALEVKLVHQGDGVHAVCRLKAPAKDAVLLMSAEESMAVCLLLLAGSESHPLVVARHTTRCFRDWKSFCKGAELDVLPLEKLVVPGLDRVRLKDHTCRDKQGRRILRFGIAFHI